MSTPESECKFVSCKSMSRFETFLKLFLEMIAIDFLHHHISVNTFNSSLVKFRFRCLILFLN